MVEGAHGLCFPLEALETLRSVGAEARARLDWHEADPGRVYPGGRRRRPSTKAGAGGRTA